MHYGIEVVNLGELADPGLIVKLAQAAEAAGWEGIFLWDHLAFVWDAPSNDPWIALAAVAMATKELRLGTAVTPLPRHRPQMLARTLTTLDILSEGRVVLGAGLGGVAQEYTAFGEVADMKQLAARVDEELALLDQFWAGEKVTYQGTHYRAEGVQFAPLPVQRPRIPIWIGGESAPALRRAARWDGWIAGGTNPEGQMTKTPEQIAKLVRTIEEHRTTEAPFDVALTGYSTATDGTLTREYEAAGVTWWLESLHGFRGTVEELLARVKQGPPT